MKIYHVCKMAAHVTIRLLAWWSKENFMIFSWLPVNFAKIMTFPWQSMTIHVGLKKIMTFLCFSWTMANHPENFMKKIKNEKLYLKQFRHIYIIVHQCTHVTNTHVWCDWGLTDLLGCSHYQGSGCGGLLSGCLGSPHCEPTLRCQHVYLERQGNTTNIKAEVNAQIFLSTELPCICRFTLCT